jgi:hypothetical protein
MEILRTASFSALFGVTFVIGAVFHLLMTLVSIFLAFTHPGVFQMNGQDATSPGQALGALLFMEVIALMVNATISVIGAGVWVGVRRFLPQTKSISAA